MLTTINLDDTLGLELTSLAKQSNKPLGKLLEEIINLSFKQRYNSPVFTVNVSVCNGIWTAECDALGLVTEADSYETLTVRAWEIAPELAELNAIDVTVDTLRLCFTHEPTCHGVAL